MHKPGFKIPALALALPLLFSLPSVAAVQDVNVGSVLPRAALLKEGSHRYLRYMRSGDVSAPLDIVTREIRFVTKGGEKQMQIRARYDSAPSAPSLRVVDSWFDAGTFRPRTHERVSDKDGKRVVEGFVFSAEKVSGMPDLADNTRKDFSVASPEPTFNFETDMEMLQALPLADGYEARINFYHPGGSSPPARYTFKVTGSASIAGPAGMVDCWVVTTDYNRPGYVSTFWFAKGSQVLVRQDSPAGDGKVMVKALIE